MNRIVWIALGLVACGGDTDGETTETLPTTAEGGCRDPEVNPWAGTCAEAYWVGCFDPQGECSGTVSLTGDVELTWANGAQVLTDMDLSSPLDPVANTEIIASDGTVCATGQSENGAQGCASRTVYVRGSDSAELVYCANLQGDLTVTCPDGTEVSVTAEENQAASGCEYGGGEPCDITFGG